MSWDFRIISPNEAAALNADFGEYIPRTALASFREVYDWIVSRAADWSPRDVDSVAVAIGPNGGAVLHLKTERWEETAAEAIRRGEEFSTWMKSYVPRDDEGVTEIHVSCRGTGDITLIAQCAERFNATVLDCSSGEFMTPQEWIRRYRKD